MSRSTVDEPIDDGFDPSAPVGEPPAEDIDASIF